MYRKKLCLGYGNLMIKYKNYIRHTLTLINTHAQDSTRRKAMKVLLKFLAQH